MFKSTKICVCEREEEQERLYFIFVCFMRIFNIITLLVGSVSKNVTDH